MWRHLRGLHQRLNRSLCLDKLDTSSKDGQVKPYKSSGCALIKHICPVTSHLCCDSNKEKKKKYYDESAGKISQHSFLEAFGWSGALVFCWAVSKHLWLSKTLNRDEDNTVTNFRYNQNIIRLLSHIAKTQPPVHHVLPQIKPVSTDEIHSDRLSRSSEPSKDIDEFDEAARELQTIHHRTIGASLNRRGISCLSKSTGSEAMSFFLRASEFKYPPASFNMGQCYELGIGTDQDFRQAAEWYSKASEQGHPTAMYNLGVFYAHGWGGLKADIDVAKKLFLKAAKLGQPDAIAALDTELKNNSNLIYNSSKTSSNNFDAYSAQTETTTELNVLVSCFKNGLSDDVFQHGFGTDTSWNVSLNSALAF